MNPTKGRDKWLATSIELTFENTGCDGSTAQLQPQGSWFHNPSTKYGIATSGRHCDFRLHLRLLPEASIDTKYDGIGDWWVKFRIFQLVISNVYNVCWWHRIFLYSRMIQFWFYPIRGQYLKHSLMGCCQRSLTRLPFFGRHNPSAAFLSSWNKVWRSMANFTAANIPKSSG